MRRDLYPAAALALLATVSLATTQDAGVARSPAAIRFVQSGTARAVREIGGAWERGPDRLTGSGTHNLLVATSTAGSGDVLIHARIALDAIDGSSASLVIGGSNHFGFDGRQHTPFVEGPLFGGLQLLASPVPPLVPDRAFDAEIERRGTLLTLRLDGTTVFDTTIAANTVLGSIALRPWRATMSVHEFWARGDLIEAAPSVLDAAVFVGGSDGYHTFRIPATAIAGDALLVFCEGRRSGGGDSGDIDLVLRRSTDGGRSFEPLRVVWDDGSNTCGNPCPVVDAKTGTVWLLMTWNRGDDREAAIIAGTSVDTRRVFVTRSDDLGKSWSTPAEITASVKDPEWTWYATGPGNGIQIAHGVHAGRMVVPCDHIEATTRAYRSHCILSDDGGASWRHGGSTPDAAVNECAVAELADGRLVLNMRNYDRTQHTRQLAWSTDGAESWAAQRHDPALIEPICQASLLRWAWAGSDGEPGRLLFANPASATGRVGMTVRQSRDDGASWADSIVLHAGPSAYSSLVALPDGRAVCVFEAGDAHPYEAIVLMDVRFAPPR